jgi:hypothetical protein
MGRGLSYRLSISIAQSNLFRDVWMVVPTYHLAARIMDDAGFAGRLRGIPEDDEGVDTVKVCSTQARFWLAPPVIQMRCVEMGSRCW